MGDINQAAVIKTRRLRLVLAVAVIAAIALAGAAGIGIYRYITHNLSALSSDLTAAQVAVSVPKGASTRQIGEILVQAKLIRNAGFFAWYVRYKQEDGLLRSGDYSLNPALNMDSIISALRKGPLPIRVTIPEGFTTQQIADLLAEKNLIDKSKFFQAVKSYDFKFDFLQGLPQSDLRLEGFLFPATYEIEKGTPEPQIIEMMLRRFNQELTPDVQQVIKQRGWTTSQFVTLASLIEKEAKEEVDRPLISQVFLKRLRIGMPLQSCASIEFLLGHPKPILSYKDLEIKSPYNTYQNKGLPPGPIANPGHASLQAAANPANTDYLYFVAKPDGYHAFSKTYAEQLRNEQKYLR